MESYNIPFSILELICTLISKKLPIQIKPFIGIADVPSVNSEGNSSKGAWLCKDLKAENVTLKAELLELSKAPAAKPIKAKPEQIDPAKLTNYQKLKLSRGEEI